jgi:dienelactone hydrolase
MTSGSGSGSSDTSYLKKVAQVESAGQANAKAPTSSAAGLFQFTEGTWKQMTKQMGLNYSLEDRFDPKKSEEVASYFTKQQRRQLEKGTGREASDSDMYMAHFLGAGGATKFLNAMAKNPNAPASEGADAKALEANRSIFYTKEGQMRSLQDVYNIMSNKINKAGDLIATGKKLQGMPFIDANRIGIQGWSYGGFMSSLAITKGADVFKMAIAVAPVTNWKWYDNIYTERFMRTPKENQSGYDDNSPINFVKQMKGKYLLIHGSGDDNVHYQNTMEMVNALVAADKQFDLFIYPNKNHGIYGGNTRNHLYNMMLNYTKENL